MYGKDKNKPISIRLTSKQYEFVSMLADTLGTSKTEIIRGYINKAIGGSAIYEHKQANINDKF